MTEQADDTPGALGPERLRRVCSLAGEPRAPASVEIEEAAGQSRAVEAVGLAAGIRRAGYNLFVTASSPSAARHVVGAMLSKRARALPRPPDRVYVNNFQTPNHPVAIELPAGRAGAFRDGMAELVDDLRSSLPAMFESEEYRNRREKIDDEINTRREAAFEALGERAQQRGAAILRTPMGLAVAPVRDGKVIPPDEFQTLDEDERDAAQHVIAEVQAELQALMRTQPRLEKERREAVRALDRETARMAVDHAVDEVAARFRDVPRVLAHLETVREALIERAALFLLSAEERSRGMGPPAHGDQRFAAFTVNALVAQRGDEDGAPVVFEDHPTLMNLIGRIEHVAVEGALVTNFTLIRAGALHRANGGFLLLEARQLLSQPFAWAALKRALRAGAIRIVSPAEELGFAATVSLEPDPVPLDVKVAIFGERLHYHLLLALDPEMRELFKILADFEEDAPWTPDAAQDLADGLAAVARREGVRPLGKDAAEALVEHSARLSGDAARLSLDIGRLADRMREADHFAGAAGRQAIARADVERAVNAELRRIGRVRERAEEAILRDLARIDVDGMAVGQVNGLSVSQVGDLRFGRPARITARVRLGEGGVVDIEREVELGGPVHSKGVLILGGFLAGRYAPDAPLSLSATLVLEQSYGGIDGDSASCAELLALLSALSELPLRQDLAVTGSVDQHGRLQAIGGVNEKIEGFFDICAARGLTGRQGVLIPEANVQHLMLREDVVAACREDRFAVYPLRTADACAALMSGRPAGARGADGRFPEGSVNRRVEERLAAFARARRAFGAGPEGGPPGAP